MMKICLSALSLLISTGLYAQDLQSKINWFNLDYAKDSVQGMSVDKAYAELLKGKPSKTVIVGVIDSGVDIQHEDLKDHIWINTDEIPGNGIDDDKNGFIDDINGWDFIGGADGRDVLQEQLESARLMVKYDKLFGPEPKKRTLKKYKAEYKEYLTIKKEIEEKKKEAEQYLPLYEGLLENYTNAEKILKNALGKEEISVADVEGMSNENQDLNVRQAKQYWLRLRSMGADEDNIKEGIDHFNSQLNYNYNLDFDAREIVGDNPKKLEYGEYGNNEVRGPRALHGTHVSGIIGADRNNGLGINGVAENVQIMVVRTVPDGDERDKDVANAIRYAVDNGAQVINMSFGKAYSPDKNWVDDAVKYAEEKGVLLIAAAGNESQNVDEHPHYPTKEFKSGGVAANWITVGASSYTRDEKLAAEFSNFGAKGVDVFAPGVAIYSSEPDSKYGEKQGTSMAAPAVTGVAALLKSYFPELTAVQIKKIIMDSVEPLGSLKVNAPGGDKKVPFSTLSKTGGVVNAYNAVKMALDMGKNQ